MHDVLMITYNRPEYTQLALSRLLESCDGNMRVWVWHNGDHTPTLDVVRELSSHRKFYKLQISRDNKKLREPTNWFWEQSTGDYVSKVDDDCLLPDGWGATLVKAHEANKDFGVIGCWRFYDEDFVPEVANKKIRRFNGGHQLMLNPWVQGSGYVMKRECIKTHGFIKPGESFSSYCIRLGVAGFTNGWYFPFLHEEHMDDPRSPYCLIKTDEQFMAQRPLSAVNDNVCTVAEWGRRVQYMARNAQEANPDPRYYSGWRRSLRAGLGKVRRMFGAQEPWRSVPETQLG